MAIDAGQVDEKIEVRRYSLQQPLAKYTFPTETPRIHEVRFDETYIHVDLVDGRILSIPLAWIPTLHQAEIEEREKYEINRSRTGLIWDPDTCAINEELFIKDYLGPYPTS